MRVVLRGLIASLSIAAGYLPIAFSFGISAMQSGMSQTTTILTSVILYAGASQFVLIALLTSGAGLLTVVPTVLLMNARHLFYGPALLKRFTDPVKRLPAPMLAFGLTDEVFAATLSKVNAIAPEERERWYLGMQLGAYGSWIAGTVLGTVLSAGFTDPPVFVREALAFVLPALFVTLLLEIGFARSLRTIIVSASVTAALLSVLPNYHALAFGMLAGAAFNAFGGRR